MEKAFREAIDRILSEFGQPINLTVATGAPSNDFGDDLDWYSRTDVPELYWKRDGKWVLYARENPPDTGLELEWD